MNQTQNHARSGNSRKMARNVSRVERELSGQRPMWMIHVMDEQEAEPQGSALRGGAP